MNTPNQIEYERGLLPTGSPTLAGTVDQFRKQLESLLNSQSMENRSDTPDFILAQYMTDSLEAFDRAVNRREVWLNRKALNVAAPVMHKQSSPPPNN